ncbi:MAG: MFS transporter, partial [Myxococcota bacterium]
RQERARDAPSPRRRSRGRAPSTERALTSKYLLLASLYVSQYLGISFILLAVPAILRESGTALEDLAWVYGLGLIWSLKFLWAPLVDRFGSERFGHYRGWLMLTQSLLFALIGIAALLDIHTDLPRLAVCFAAIVFVASTQDIAADALAVTLLAPEERGLGNSVQMAGGLLGGVLGGGLTLMAYASLGWRGAMGVLALATALPLIQILAHRERPAPADLRSDKAGFRDFARFVKRPGNLRWLAVLLTADMGIGLGYALLNPMLVDLGWGLDRIGFAVNIVGSIAGMAGAFLAGWLVVRIGRKAAMAASQGFVALSLVALMQPGRGVDDPATLYTAIGLMLMAWAANATIASTLMMDKSDPTRAGTDYTLQFSVASITSHTLAASALGLAGAVGYPGVLGIGLGLCALALFAIWRYDGFAPASFPREASPLGGDVARP